MAASSVLLVGDALKIIGISDLVDGTPATVVARPNAHSVAGKTVPPFSMTPIDPASLPSDARSLPDGAGALTDDAQFLLGDALDVPWIAAP